MMLPDTKYIFIIKDALLNGSRFYNDKDNVLIRFENSLTSKFCCIMCHSCKETVTKCGHFLWPYCTAQKLPRTFKLPNVIKTKTRWEL